LRRGMRCPTEDASIDEKVQQVWNAKATHSGKSPDRFWFFPQITAHANARICGQLLPGSSAGLHQWIKEAGRFAKAVSIGCGMASKELNLVRTGIVESFDLYEVANERLEKAKQAFASKGLERSITPICADAFASSPEDVYDLVYWNSSLHHMPDVHVALEWSKRALRPGGVLAMYEFIGPTRFQWSDRNLEFVRRFRQALPGHLRPPAADRWIVRPTIDEMIKRDPSEAADSANILPALLSIFPDATVTTIGGALYHFGLNGIYPKLREEDAWVFDAALAMDDALLEMGEVHFAAALARKPLSL